ncbi:hypothetical protein FQR65_LT08555 [Abscondita terminalis]|nr:hypothetical protein FQR65_LT08555 [Abscondita terminalis]
MWNTLIWCFVTDFTMVKYVRLVENIGDGFLTEWRQIQNRYHSERAVEHNLNEIDEILRFVEHSSSTSTRRISARIGVPRVRIWQTLREQSLYPFHVRVQHLEPTDHVRRLELCEWVNANR